METIGKNINVSKKDTVVKKENLVFNVLNQIKNNSIKFKTREQKNNYIFSLRSTGNTNVKLKIKMKEDFREEYRGKLDLKKGKTYDIEIVKYDIYDDGKLAVSHIVKGTEYQTKIFTDRFDIIPSKPTIGDTGIIENAFISIIKADEDMVGMAGHIKPVRNNQGIATFTNLRGTNLYLEKGDIIKIENTDHKIILGIKNQEKGREVEKEPEIEIKIIKIIETNDNLEDMRSKVLDLFDSKEESLIEKKIITIIESNNDFEDIRNKVLDLFELEKKAKNYLSQFYKKIVS